jgi:hypothetical protein
MASIPTIENSAKNNTAPDEPSNLIVGMMVVLVMVFAIQCAVAAKPPPMPRYSIKNTYTITTVKIISMPKEYAIV